MKSSGRLALISFLSFAMIVVFHTMARADGVSEPVRSAVEDIKRAGGGNVNINISAKTGLVSFMGTSGAHPIPTGLPASSSPEKRALAFLGTYGRAFGIADTSQVQITRVQVNDDVGMDHVRLQQTHNGIPVTAGN